MTIRKDGRRRSVEMSLELPGSPEEVFRVFATGAGYSAWFTPTTIEERVGGKVAFDLGGGVVPPGVVKAWEPPRHVSYEESDWSGDAPPITTDVFVEAKSGGVCVVRMVHSLFTERDDWDEELEGMEAGWTGFFGVLRTYLTHFAGQPSALLRASGVFAGEAADGWAPLVQGLGLEGAKAGDAVETAAGAPRLAGVVEDAYDGGRIRAMRLRLSEPGPGVALIGAWAWDRRGHAAASLYFYGAEATATAAREGPAWYAWMAERFSTSGS